MLLRRRMSRLARSTVKFAGSMPRASSRRSPVCDVEQAEGEPARLAGQPSAGPQRTVRARRRGRCGG